MGWYRRWGKRTLDVAAVVGASPMAIAFALVVAILVRLFSGPSVLFCQRRPGLEGRPFTLLKFRTMSEARDEYGNPLPDAGLSEIQEFYSGASTRIAIAVGLVAINVVCLVFFGSAVAKRLQAFGESAVAARAALAGVVLLGGAFLVGAVIGFPAAYFTGRLQPGEPMQAEALGLPSGTVKSRTARGLERLRETYD